LFHIAPQLHPSAAGNSGQLGEVHRHPARLIAATPISARSRFPAEAPRPVFCSVIAN